jgi:thiol peroxidase
MRQAITTIMLCVFVAACSEEQTNQVQADLPIDKGSVKAGIGSSVAMAGNPLELVGTGAVEVGEMLPAALLSSTELKPVDIADGRGKVRIISVVPSLDTPTCDKQTHVLSEQNDGLDQKVQLVTVSMDLPFAQARFAQATKITNVTFLSDYNGREFGNKNGLLIKPLALLARAVIVIDAENIVRHLQIVPELTALPDMEAAMAAARALL